MVPTLFGVTAGHGVAPAAFVLATAYTPDPGGTQHVTFGGATAGQLAILISTRSNCITPSGWTLVDSFTWTYTEQVFSKILSAGDIASGVDFSYAAGNGTFMLLVYSGATVCTAVSSASSVSTSSQVVTGFNKNAASKMLVTYGVCDNAAGAQTKPTGWTSRLAAFGSPYGGTGASSSAVAELMPGSYANGAPITWTGFPTPPNLAAAILELT